MSDNHRARHREGGVAASEALVRVRDGLATTSDVAILAAEVLANPPPLMAAARRFLAAVGSQEARAAATEFLALLANEPSD